MKKLWFLFSFLSFTIFASPQNMNVVSGEANLSNISDQHMQIETSDKAILHWDNFSIKENEKVEFLQQSAKSSVLNRVIGNTSSEILGSLTSNGQILLLNPKGIFIGEKAIIDVSSFIASTLDVLDEDYLTQSDLAFAGESKAIIQNFGTIKAFDGDAFLVAYKVENVGTIEAKQTAAMASGLDILIKPNASEKVFIRSRNLEKEMKTIGILNTGDISSQNIELKADGSLFEIAICHEGKADALSSSIEDGRVFLHAGNGRNEIKGSIQAKSNDQGGTVHLLGDQVHLFESSQIIATGENGGGEVLIGGDYQGKNPEIPNAKIVFVEKNVLIDASALENGSGGKVILWGDEGNAFYGQIKAEGGKTSGNGGFVEISSPKFLDPAGIVSTKAYSGNIGTLLLDPTDVTISSSADSNASYSSGSYTFSAATANINVTNLATNLGSSNVTIDTDNAETGTGTITLSNALSWSAATSLTLTANGNITLNATITNTGGGALIMLTPDIIYVLNAITITGGSFSPNSLEVQAGTLNHITANISVPGNVLIENHPSDPADLYYRVRDCALDSTAGTITIGSDGDEIRALDIEGGTLTSYGNFIAYGFTQLFKVGDGTQTIATSISSSAGDVTITNIDSGTTMLLVGSNAASVATRIYASDSHTITIDSAGPVTLVGGSNAGAQASIDVASNGPIDITATTLTLTAGSGDSAAYARINATDTLDISANRIVITPSDVANAYLYGANDITITDVAGGMAIYNTSGSPQNAYIRSNAGHISISGLGTGLTLGKTNQAGSSYISTGGTDKDITIDGAAAITMTSGAGATYINAELGSVLIGNTVNVNSLTMVATTADVYITIQRQVAEYLRVRATGDITMTAGSTGRAFMYSTGDTIQLYATNLTMTGGTSTGVSFLSGYNGGYTQVYLTGDLTITGGSGTGDNYIACNENVIVQANDIILSTVASGQSITIESNNRSALITYTGSVTATAATDAPIIFKCDASLDNEKVSFSGTGAISLTGASGTGSARIYSNRDIEIGSAVQSVGNITLNGNANIQSGVSYSGYTTIYCGDLTLEQDSTGNTYIAADEAVSITSSGTITVGDAADASGNEAYIGSTESTCTIDFTTALNLYGSAGANGYARVFTGSDGTADGGPLAISGTGDILLEGGSASYAQALITTYSTGTDAELTIDVSGDITIQAGTAIYTYGWIETIASAMTIGAITPHNNLTIIGGSVSSAGAGIAKGGENTTKLAIYGTGDILLQASSSGIAFIAAWTDYTTTPATDYLRLEGNNLTMDSSGYSTYISGIDCSIVLNLTGDITVGSALSTSSAYINGVNSLIIERAGNITLHAGTDCTSYIVAKDISIG
nr:filamentous hemagglutinin N-terminal domain-containing protein [Chlamydiales bacterium]